LQVSYAVLTFYFLMPFVFMSIFTSDKRFFAADTAARLYHPAQYYLSKVTVTLPFNIIVAIVFHLVCYGMAGMRHSAVAMAASGLICVLTGLIGMQVGSFVCSCRPIVCPIDIVPVFSFCACFCSYIHVY
jgi:ABC-type multidrug transport system permease subunit